ncbi:MAG: hypothetical protein KA715_05365 [Xanthomonadaceae bacterium]|nr:hypothetical protein [Xanthomonadaceae bacterium]
MISKPLQRLLKNREALQVLMFSGIGAIFSLLSNRLLTEVATPSELGKLYLLLNLTLWIIIPTSSSYLYIVHNWPVAIKNNLTHWFLKRIIYALFIQSWLSIIICWILYHFQLFEVSSVKIALCVCLMAIFQALFQTFYSIPTSERRRVLAGILDWMNTFGRPLFLSLGVLFAGESSLNALLNAQTIHSLSAGVLASSFFYLLLKQRKASHSGKTGFELLSFNSYKNFFLPTFFTTIIAQAAASAERWGLAQHSDTSSTAIFVQAIGLSLAVAGVINSILMGYFYPIITQSAAESVDSPLKSAWKPVIQFLKLSVFFYIIMALFGFLFSRILTPLLFGAKFLNVESILPITLLGTAVMGLTQTITIPIYTARDALSPNVAKTISLSVYLTLLLLTPKHLATPINYAWIYTGSQFLFLLLVSLSFRMHAKAASRI